MENNRFEDSFRNAFAGAEVSPSEMVWANIALELEKSSGGKVKRSLLLLPLLAAASVAFAFGVTALFYADQPVTPGNSGQETLGAVSPSSGAIKESDNQDIASGKKSVEKENTASLKHTVPHVVYERAENQETPAVELPVNPPAVFTISRKDLSALVKTEIPSLVLAREEEAFSEPDVGMVLLARLKDEEKKYRDEEKKRSGTQEKLWASVGFGAGSYRPNVQSSSVNLGLISLNGSAPSSESVTGSSYSAGVQVAAKISKRFIVQGGVSYLTQSADFTSTVSMHEQAALSAFVRLDNFDSYQGTNPYVVNSSMQFVSIPVQAGYLLIDQAFALQLTGGVATDLFLSNTLLPEHNTYQKVTLAAGKESPYRTVSFSGLVGTEFSYRVAERYRVSLNPGLRYSLHSIYKNEVAGAISPVTYDVSLRFRYIFK